MTDWMIWDTTRRGWLAEGGGYTASPRQAARYDHEGATVVVMAAWSGDRPQRVAVPADKALREGAPRLYTRRGPA